MNGTRMNQLVAPTSFITSISRRRANIAIRMVLRIEQAGGEEQEAATTKMPTVSDLDRSWMSWIVLVAEDDVLHARLGRGTCWPATRPSPASLFTGSTRNDGGRSSAVTLSTISGESANSRLNSS